MNCVKDQESRTRKTRLSFVILHQSGRCVKGALPVQVRDSLCTNSGIIREQIPISKPKCTGGPHRPPAALRFFRACCIHSGIRPGDMKGTLPSLCAMRAVTVLICFWQRWLPQRKWVITGKQSRGLLSMEVKRASQWECQAQITERESKPKFNFPVALWGLHISGQRKRKGALR